MTIKRIDTNHRMSQAVVHNSIVYLAGQVATGATITEQTRSILAQVDALLAQAGTSKANLLSATIWLCDMTDFAAMDVEWDAWLEGVAAPTRASGQLLLASPEYRVEIIIVAAVQNA